jgi:hypothetical protein
MKPFNADTILTFGKYEGQSLESAFAMDPQYIEKCMNTVEDFVISEKSLQTLLKDYADYEISPEAISANSEKLDVMENLSDEGFDFEDDKYEDDDEFGIPPLGEEDEEDDEDGWEDEDWDEDDEDDLDDHEEDF